MKVVIIEDEILTARDLERTIKTVDDSIEVVANIKSVEEGKSFLIKDPAIDLIFSDIELSDGLSFEIFESITLKTPVIYCTAFDQYALEAFKSFGIDYILKPFSISSVEKALKKFEIVKTRPQEDYSGLMLSLKQHLYPSKKKSIIVQKGDKLIPLKVEELALFFIKNEQVMVQSFDGKRYIVNGKLQDYEDQFSPLFFRANRQHLVNRKAIVDSSQYFNRKLIINLNVNFSEKVIVGKLKVTQFLSWLENN